MLRESGAAQRFGSRPRDRKPVTIDSGRHLTKVGLRLTQQAPFFQLKSEADEQFAAMKSQTGGERSSLP